MKMPRASASLVLAAAALFFASVAHAETFDCAPVEVLELGNRIHVRCADPRTVTSQRGTVDSMARSARQIRYLAIGKDDTNMANRFTSLATAALVSNKTFRAVISQDGSRNTAGCNANDCRTPVAFGIAK